MDFITCLFPMFCLRSKIGTNITDYVISSFNNQLQTCFLPLVYVEGFGSNICLTYLVFHFCGDHENVICISDMVLSKY